MDKIAQKIQRFRQLLAKDADSICFADIKDGFDGEMPLLDGKPLNAQHIKMLKIFDGGRFGCIDIWSVADLPTQQFYLEPDLFTAYSRDNQALQAYFAKFDLSDFYVFAQTFYEPILLNRLTGEIIFPIDYDSPCQKKPLANFLLDNVLGQDYAVFYQVTDEQIVDDWLSFIQENS